MLVANNGTMNLLLFFQKLWSNIYDAMFLIAAMETA